MQRPRDMNPRLTIAYRPATREDLTGIRSLLQSCDLPLAGVADHLDTFVVATADEHIVACAGMERYGDAALLRSCVVDARYRRQGLGHALVWRAISLATSQGVRELVLLTTTAEGYFPHFGFQRISREEVADSLKASQEFAGACPASASVMRLKLALSS